MMKWIYKHPIIAAGMCILVPPTVLQVLYWILCKYSIDCFVYPLSESDILGYCGSIISGMIGGVFAIWVLKDTLKNERNLSKKDNQIKVLPFLDYQIVNQKSIESKRYISVFDTEHSIGTRKCIEIQLMISNWGVGNALYVYGKAWNVDREHLIDDSIIRQCIPIDKSANVSYRIALPSYDTHDQEVGQREQFYKVFEYFDIFGNKYTDIIKFEFYRMKYWNLDTQIIEETIEIVDIDRDSKKLLVQI